MTRLRLHPGLLVAIMALVVWAGCAKRPVGYQRTAAEPSSPAPTAVRPAPAPQPPSAASPAGPSSPAGGAVRETPLATPTAPPAGGQRPNPAEFSAGDVLKDIYFDFDRHAIRPDAATTLMAGAAWLKAHPASSVLVEGHCDERGTVEYNLALGQRRAQSARDFLLAQGIPAGRIATISYGKERPVCPESTEECWARNRRAHFPVKPS